VEALYTQEMMFGAYRELYQSLMGDADSSAAQAGEH